MFGAQHLLINPIFRKNIGKQQAGLSSCATDMAEHSAQPSPNQKSILNSGFTTPSYSIIPKMPLEKS